MDKIFALLHAQRIRPTLARIQILAALDASGGAKLGTKQIFRLISQADRSISQASVYRVLKTMHEEGLIQRAYCHETDDVRFVYFMGDNDTEHERPEMLCVLCHRSMALDLPSLRQELNRQGKAAQLQPDGRSFVIHITCQECIKKARALNAKRALMQMGL